MKTILILAASLLLAAVILAISLRLLQWIVSAICYILSGAIDLFREISASLKAINMRLRYLVRFTYRASNMIRLKIRKQIRRTLRRATPIICNSLTLMSWMLSRASHTVYLRYHHDNNLGAASHIHSLTSYGAEGRIASHGI